MLRFDEYRWLISLLYRSSKGWACYPANRPLRDQLAWRWDLLKDVYTSYKAQRRHLKTLVQTNQEADAQFAHMYPIAASTGPTPSSYEDVKPKPGPFAVSSPVWNNLPLPNKVE